ncbi:MAG: bifunctional nuclease family protein [Actinomycetia bacterium]|nr:bifunctional nuclease family protein [Actinomycetes bacterium]
MKPLEVMGVRVEMPTNQPIVLLRERDGDRFLPIWIGAAEATAIAYVQQGVEPPRPLTHDLIVNLLTELGHEVSAVRIDSLVDNVFFATLIIDGGTEISARPSDAIAVALRVGAQVFAEATVLDEAGVHMPEEQEDDVEAFRDFLDHVSAEDFAEHADPDADDPDTDRGPDGPSSASDDDSPRR